MLNKNTVLLSLDVEAGFLYEPAFSYGYVLGTIDGTVIEEDYVFSELDAIAIEYVEESDKHFKWLSDNVLSVTGHYTTDKYYISELFASKWIKYKDTYGDNLIMLADVPFPCESSFLFDLMVSNLNGYLDYADRTEFYDNQFKYSPYPILDLASILISNGLPTTFERLPNELPIHHPLNDARQTYRKFIDLVASDVIKVEGVNM